MAAMQGPCTSTGTACLRSLRSLLTSPARMQAEQVLAKAAATGLHADQYTCSIRVQAALAQRNTRAAWTAVQAARAADVTPSLVSRTLPCAR